MSAWFPRVTVHSLAIVVSILTYVLTTRAERERRPPAIAIAWVLGMMALPYLVLPMYLFFGRRKLPRKISRWSGRRSYAQHWAEDLIESFGLPPAANSQVRFHRDGVESHAGLLSTMNGANRRLDICTYILGHDPVGREVTDLMIACVSRGVRVRFLIDGVGALQLPQSWFRRLNGAGVETAIFSPLLARKTQGPRNLRNHRKWVVADGERLWTGGRNLAAEYFMGVAGIAPWSDLTFELAGPAASSAALQFEADWEAAGGGPAETIPVSAGQYADSRTQFLPSGPDQMEDTVHALLIDACFQATSRMLAVTPYFVPDASLETAMRLAARRGVKIDLCIPAKSNHLLADFVRNRSLRALSTAGVSIHLLPYMNHAKAVVFDDSLALCGSCNLDSRSLLLNYESTVVFYDAPEIEWLARWMYALIPAARSFDPRAPGLWRDVCEGLLLTVAYQL
ncbi:MAG TPA: phospholipase D-like domain-containing protein [Steroidobacteraceae bacterium]|nr:phospholipase D-like domain-containing protein [Steroidobacteraceae bacterium]